MELVFLQDYRLDQPEHADFILHKSRTALLYSSLVWWGERKMSNNQDYNREEITTILRLHRAGVPAAEICSMHNISEASFIQLQRLYGNGLSIFAGTRQPARATGPLIEKLLNRQKR